MKQRIIRDIHCHIMEPHSLIPAGDFIKPSVEHADEIEEIRSFCGLDSLAVPAITLYDREDFVCNPLALLAKLKSPDRVYALAGIRRYLDIEDNNNMLQQARLLIESGFDGFKMICKPNARRQFRVSIDDGIFDEFYGEAQQRQWPILFHVGDPASFWDEKLVPGWARESGWYYGGEPALPSCEELYREVERLLKKFPDLKITFAHFLFLSGNLQKAAELLESYPNICLDITPGSEMYLDFGKNTREAASFFERYRHRILFGTDNVAEAGEGREENRRNCAAKINRIRRFLETGEELEIEGERVNGLSLSEETLDAVYQQNFLTFFSGLKPVAVQPAAMIEFMKRYAMPEEEQARVIMEILRK